MRASPSSSSCNLLAASSLTNRVKTIFKKAYELSTLCEIEVCVICYGPAGKLSTWPEEREKVKDMALRYANATKRKKSLDLREFLAEKKKKDSKNGLKYPDFKKKKKKKNGFKYPDWYPIFDHYSPHQLSQLILSLEQTHSTLQGQLRFVEAQKQRNINLQPSSSLTQHRHQYQTQPFSLFSTSHSNQHQNHHMMQNKLYGSFDHSITNANFQHPCVSNTQDYPPLLPVQEPAVSNNGLKNHLVLQQHEPYGFDQNMCMMVDTTNNYSNLLEHPCLSNTV